MASRDSRSPQADLAQRVAAVDEQPSVRHEGRSDPSTRLLAGLRMPPVERADAHREYEIVGSLAGEQGKVLRGHAPHAHPSGLDLGAGIALCEGNPLRRAID